MQAKLKESYKRTRKEDDINQPLSVQPWGSDSLKRRYWLIEGQDDTHFRVYRESSPATAIKHRTWWSVAGNIEELRAVAQALVDEKTLNSRRLGEKMLASIPRFEVSEEVRSLRDSIIGNPLSLVMRTNPLFLILLLETQTPRIPPRAQGSVQRTVLPVLRGPDARQATQVHLLRRGGLGVR